MRAPAAQLVALLSLLIPLAPPATAQIDEAELGGACATSFDCSTPAAPVCDSGTCTAGPALCVSDDSADLGTGDDGPAVGQRPRRSAGQRRDLQSAGDRGRLLQDHGRGPGLPATGALLDRQRRPRPARLQRRRPPLRRIAPPAARIRRSPHDSPRRLLHRGPPQGRPPHRRRRAVRPDAGDQRHGSLLQGGQRLHRPVDLHRPLPLDLRRPLLHLQLGDRRSRRRAVRQRHQLRLRPLLLHRLRIRRRKLRLHPDLPDERRLRQRPRRADLLHRPRPEPLPARLRRRHRVRRRPRHPHPRPRPPWDYYTCTVAAQRCTGWIFKDGFEGGDEGYW